MEYREHIEWRDIWVTGAGDESMPRVLLVGDSITRSYYDTVDAALKSTFHCARLTTSTCVAARVMERELELLLGEYTFSVIHFNNGLHGWEYDEEAYADGLDRTFRLLKERTPKSRLIWASTTPVWRRDDLKILDRKTDRVRERNRLAQKLTLQHGLPVNDLFACVIDHPEFISPDGVHFNSAGQSALGQQVADTIRQRGAE